MRGCLALWMLLVGSCASPSPVAVPVTVMGDGEDGVVLGHAVHLGSSVDGLRYAGQGSDWPAFRRAGRGDYASVLVEEPDFQLEQWVAVPVPGGERVTGIVVQSEEGVDVVTIDIEAGGAAPSGVCLLRLSRRKCQIAIVLRDQGRGREQTLTVLSGS